MLATFLLIVGHNSRYCLLRNTFGRSHWIVSGNFNKVLKALNTIAHEMMAKHGLAVPSKIRESTRFYPYLKVRIVCRFYFYFVSFEFIPNDKLNTLSGLYWSY